MRTLRVALFMLLVACGGDDVPVSDGGVAADSSADTSQSDAQDLDGSLKDANLSDGAFADSGADGGDTDPVDDTIYYEEFVLYSNPEWLEGVTVRTPVTLATDYAEVELRAIREFFGDVRLEDASERVVLGSVNPNFVSTAALDSGDYTIVVEYPGVVVADPRTAHVTTRVATPPRLAEDYATFVGTVAELERTLGMAVAAHEPFTVRAGHRYVAHGLSGMTTCLIVRPEDVEVLLRGDSVVPFHQWGGGSEGGEVADRAAPQPMYLDLAPGDYTLFAFNGDTIDHGLVVTIDEWALVNP